MPLTVTPEQRGERIRIGATVREFRQARGIRQEELAEALGISRSYLSNIEAGRKPLTKLLLAKFAAHLNVTQASIVRAGYFEDAA